MFRLQAPTFWVLLCIMLPTFAQATPDYDAGAPKSNQFWWGLTSLIYRRCARIRMRQILMERISHTKKNSPSST